MYYEWLVPQLVALIRLEGVLDVSKLAEADRVIISEILDKSSAEQVHLIFDNTRMYTIPPQNVYRHIHFTGHERLGWMVSFGNNELTRFFLTKLADKKRLYIQTLESKQACLDFLSEMDTDLSTASTS
ncbi:MAG: hypothetical protein L0154_26580 [Chloroflexi bacterium]|nr:hypothetical protein [Chloroflexota bacterium]